MTVYQFVLALLFVIKFDDYSRISSFCDAIVNRVDPIHFVNRNF